jgi:DNA-binding GntR family transcriptional regulator
VYDNEGNQGAAVSVSKSSPRAETAYQSLRQAINTRALLPGAKLPEDQIGSHFGTSRTLVRATLALFQTERLVDARRKRTATIARPTFEEVRDVFEVRRAWEREAVALTIRRWSEFGAALEGHVREDDPAHARRDDRVTIRLAGEFHIKLTALSGNKILHRAMAELVFRCSLILAVYGRPHSSERAVNEHSEIIAALREGDAATAIPLMVEHVGSVEQRALLADAARTEPDFGEALARYARLVKAGNGAVPLPQRRARARL